MAGQEELSQLELRLRTSEAVNAKLLDQLKTLESYRDVRKVEQLEDDNRRLSQERSALIQELEVLRDTSRAVISLDVYEELLERKQGLERENKLLGTDVARLQTEVERSRHTITQLQTTMNALSTSKNNAIDSLSRSLNEDRSRKDRLNRSRDSDNESLPRVDELEAELRAITEEKRALLVRVSTDNAALMETHAQLFEMRGALDRIQSEHGREVNTLRKRLVHLEQETEELYARKSGSPRAGSPRNAGNTSGMAGGSPLVGRASPRPGSPVVTANSNEVMALRTQLRQEEADRRAMERRLQQLQSLVEDKLSTLGALSNEHDKFLSSKEGSFDGEQDTHSVRRLQMRLAEEAAMRQRLESELNVLLQQVDDKMTSVSQLTKERSAALQNAEELSEELARLRFERDISSRKYNELHDQYTRLTASTDANAVRTEANMAAIKMELENQQLRKQLAELRLQCEDKMIQLETHVSDVTAKFADLMDALPASNEQSTQDSFRRERDEVVSQLRSAQMALENERRRTAQARDELQDAIVEHAKAQAGLSGRIAALQEQVAGLEAESDASQDERRVLEQTVERLRGEIALTRQSLRAGADEDAMRLRGQLDAQSQNVRALEEQLASEANEVRQLHRRIGELEQRPTAEQLRIVEQRLYVAEQTNNTLRQQLAMAEQRAEELQLEASRQSPRMEMSRNLGRGRDSPRAINDSRRGGGSPSALDASVVHERDALAAQLTAMKDRYTAINRRCEELKTENAQLRANQQSQQAAAPGPDGAVALGAGEMQRRVAQTDAAHRVLNDRLDQVGNKLRRHVETRSNAPLDPILAELAEIAQDARAQEDDDAALFSESNRLMTHSDERVRSVERRHDELYEKAAALHRDNMELQRLVTTYERRSEHDKQSISELTEERDQLASENERLQRRSGSPSQGSRSAESAAALAAEVAQRQRLEARLASLIEEVQATNEHNAQVFATQEAELEASRNASSEIVELRQQLDAVLVERGQIVEERDLLLSQQFGSGERRQSRDSMRRSSAEIDRVLQDLELMRLQREVEFKISQATVLQLSQSGSQAEETRNLLASLYKEYDLILMQRKQLLSQAEAAVQSSRTRQQVHDSVDSDIRHDFEQFPDRQTLKRAAANSYALLKRSAQSFQESSALIVSLKTANDALVRENESLVEQLRGPRGG